MKRELRLQFFKIVEAKHSLGETAGIIDPWAGQKATPTPVTTNRVLNENDIFQTIKSIPGVQMIHGSCKYSDPNGFAPAQPWGKEIEFQFTYKTQDSWGASTEENKGNQNIINQVTSALMSKFSNLLMNAIGEYDGNSKSSVTITQKGTQ